METAETKKKGRSKKAEQGTAGGPEPAAPDVPKMGMVLAFTAEAKRDAEGTLDLLRRSVIQNPEAEQWALNAATQMAKTKDELVAKRQSWVAPLKKVTGEIEAEFRPIVKLLDDGISIIKAKVGEYRMALEAEKSKALAAMQATVASGDVQQAQAIATRIEQVAPPQPEGATVKMVWTGEVADAALIPAHYKIPDVQTLLAITQSQQRDPQIPGWRAFQVPAVRISRR